MLNILAASVFYLAILGGNQPNTGGVSFVPSTYPTKGACEAAAEAATKEGYETVSDWKFHFYYSCIEVPE